MPHITGFHFNTLVDAIFGVSVFVTRFSDKKRLVLLTEDDRYTVVTRMTDRSLQVEMCRIDGDSKHIAVPFLTSEIRELEHAINTTGII